MPDRAADGPTRAADAFERRAWGEVHRRLRARPADDLTAADLERLARVGDRQRLLRLTDVLALRRDRQLALGEPEAERRVPLRQHGGSADRLPDAVDEFEQRLEAPRGVLHVVTDEIRFVDEPGMPDLPPGGWSDEVWLDLGGAGWRAHRTTRDGGFLQVADERGIEFEARGDGRELTGADQRELDLAAVGEWTPPQSEDAEAPSSAACRCLARSPIGQADEQETHQRQRPTARPDPTRTPPATTPLLVVVPQRPNQRPNRRRRQTTGQGTDYLSCCLSD